MPTFVTPDPIAATVDVGFGHVEIEAGDGGETVVEVRPSNPANEADVQVADQTRVAYGNGRLTVTGPKRKNWRTVFGRPGAFDLTVVLPQGSQVDVRTWADVRAVGRLGVSSFETAAGGVQVDETGPLKIHTAAGNVSVDRASGPADVSTASGKIRLGTVEGNAVVKTSNGDIRLGEVTGDVRTSTANGEIDIERALADVDAKTGYGAIRVHEVVQGSVVLKTGFGEVEVGVREGTAAWLDVSSAATVRSDLEATDEPGPDDPQVAVRAATGWGDVIIRRAPATAAPVANGD